MIGLKSLRLVLDLFVVDSSFEPLCWPLTGDFSWPKTLCLQGLQSYKRKPEALWSSRQIWSGLAIATQIACILCTKTMPHVSWIKLFQKIVCWPFNSMSSAACNTRNVGLKHERPQGWWCWRDVQGAGGKPAHQHLWRNTAQSGNLRVGIPLHSLEPVARLEPSVGTWEPFKVDPVNHTVVFTLISNSSSSKERLGQGLEGWEHGPILRGYTNYKAHPTFGVWTGMCSLIQDS